VDPVRDLYAQLLGAWNTRRAADFAALFTPDGVSIGFDGSVATGPEIGQHLAAIFADHTPARYVARVESVRELTPDVAVLHALVGMVPEGGAELNPAVNSHQVIVAVRAADRWAIALLQNTPAQYHGRPDLAAQHLAAVQAVLDGG
jgi:uncharacterized protein (TIGR02246 family)